jgi:hypothetical protein
MHSAPATPGCATVPEGSGRHVSGAPMGHGCPEWLWTAEGRVPHVGTCALCAYVPASPASVSRRGSRRVSVCLSGVPLVPPASGQSCRTPKRQQRARGRTRGRPPGSHQACRVPAAPPPPPTTRTNNKDWSSLQGPLYCARGPHAPHFTLHAPPTRCGPHSPGRASAWGRTAGSAGH